MNWPLYLLATNCVSGSSMDNAMDNQRIIQSTPAIFSFKSWTTGVVITVEKERQTCIGLIFGG
jgi:hypothetical protein